MRRVGDPARRIQDKEIIMSNTIIRTAVLAVVVIAGASASMAQTYNPHPSPYANSNDSVRAFWDAQQRNGN
jgi:hypothetical protein